MPIKSDLNQKGIEADIVARLDARRQAMIGRLFAIAEECINNAKANHRYLVQTGNLTSSINYCIVNDGSVVTAGQWRVTVGAKGDGQEGIRTGTQYLQDVISGLPL